MMSLNIANLDRLISHLEGLPEEKFDMQNFFTKNARIITCSVGRGAVYHDCGTAACIAGWIFALAPDVLICGDGAYGWLGLPSLPNNILFEPPFFREHGRYPLSRAIRTLKHMRSEYLRTGEVVVDWDASEPVALKPWSAPKASERVLPEAIVSLLRTERHEVMA